METCSELSVLYTKADCLSSKFDEFLALISVRKPHVIIVMESLPKNCSQPEVYFLQVLEYNLVVNSNYKRGIFVYVHTSLKYLEVNEPVASNISECLVIDVKLPGSKSAVPIFAVYHSPSFNEMSICNNEHILQFLSSVSSFSSKLLVVGDFNLPYIDWTTNTTQLSDQSFENRFVQTLQDHYLHQHIQDPTRLRADSKPSVLDLVITKSPEDVNSVEFLPPLGKSDHVGLSISLNCSSNFAETPKGSPKYDYGRANYAAFRDFISSLSIPDELKQFNATADVSFEFIRQALKEGRDRYVPVFTSRQYQNKRQTLPQYIIQMLKEKADTWREHVKIKTAESWLSYKKARNKATKFLRMNRREVEADVIA